MIQHQSCCFDFRKDFQESLYMTIYDVAPIQAIFRTNYGWEFVSVH